MAGLDMTSFDAALKIKYSDKRVENMVYKKNPFLAMIRKEEDFGGKSLVLPTIYGNPQARSATFATAQTKSTSTNTAIKAFTLTRVKDYGVCVVDNETIDASEKDSGAFMRAVTTELDGIINSLARSLAITMYRTGSGSLGTVGSLPGAVNVAILTNVDDITNFEVGQDIVGSATDLGGVLRSATVLTVTNVDRTAGKITMSANFSTVSIVAGDSLFAAGDRQNVASPVAQKVSGLEAWVPATTPSSTAFFGVDRSVDTRLGGLRYAGTGYPIEEILTEAATFSAREGGSIDTFYCNFTKWSALEKALGSKVVYNDVKATSDIMFRSIKVHGPNGAIEVVPDQNCPNTRIFGLQSDTWALYSLGKVPKVLDTDGLSMLRQSSSDGVEIRYGYYAQMGCSAPGYNINVQL